MELQLPHLGDFAPVLRWGIPGRIERPDGEPKREPRVTGAQQRVPMSRDIHAVQKPCPAILSRLPVRGAHFSPNHLAAVFGLPGPAGLPCRPAALLLVPLPFAYMPVSGSWLVAEHLADIQGVPGGKAAGGLVCGVRR